MLHAYINTFYSSKRDIARYIFTDLRNDTIYTTTNFGRKISKVANLPFKPSLLSMHLTKPWIVLALDKSSPNKELYKSDDFGQTWRQIQRNVKEFHWGYAGKLFKANLL